MANSLRLPAAQRWMSDRSAADGRDVERDVSLLAKRPARTSQGWSQPATIICDKTRICGTTRLADWCIPCASYLDNVSFVGGSGSRARTSDLSALAAVEGDGHSSKVASGHTLLRSVGRGSGTGDGRWTESHSRYVSLAACLRELPKGPVMGEKSKKVVSEANRNAAVPLLWTWGSSGLCQDALSWKLRAPDADGAKRSPVK